MAERWRPPDHPALHCGRGRRRWGCILGGDTVYYTFLVGGRKRLSGGGGAAGQPAQPLRKRLPLLPPRLPLKSSYPWRSLPRAGWLDPAYGQRKGQTMWDIAAYKMSLSDLYAINGLTDQSVIFPGERLLIRLPDKT